MLPSSCSTLVLFAAIAVFSPTIQSLAIPRVPHVQVIQLDQSADNPTTTQASDNVFGDDDLILSDPSGTNDPNLNETPSGKRKPVLEVVDVIFRPFQPPSILVVDFFRKSNGTNDTASSSSEEDGSSTPFQTTTPGMDQGTTVDATNDMTPPADSSETNEGIINSISVLQQDGLDSNDSSAATPHKTNGIFTHIGIPIREKKRSNNQMTSSSLPTQEQFSTGNENNNDDAHKTSDMVEKSPNDGNDDEDASSMPVSMDVVPTLSSSKRNGSSDDIRGGVGNNNQRQKRETHQMADISNEDDDSSPSKTLTGKFQPDDMTKNNNHDTGNSNGVDSSTSSSTTPTSNNVNADDDDDNDTDSQTSDGTKSGIVKVFLEILQLVPLSNSTTLTPGNGDDGESTTSSSAVITPAEEKEDTGTKTVVQSMKANSNQKKFSADPLTVKTTTSEKKHTASENENTREEVATRKRAIRSATTKADPDHEKKGNPSTSLTASASPSSKPNSKPVTSTIAPAAPAPTTNASAQKASSNTPDDSEGPPLENVTEPVGRDDDE